MQEERNAIDPQELELCRLMTGYLEGRLDAFDGLYAALGPRLRSYLLAQCRDPTLADDLVGHLLPAASLAADLPAGPSSHALGVRHRAARVPDAPATHPPAAALRRDAGVRAVNRHGA
jgi:hypothetical protein